MIGLPIFILVFGMMFALIKGFATEDLDSVRVSPPPDVKELERES